jgi:hypothetical protein
MKADTTDERFDTGLVVALLALLLAAAFLAHVTGGA